MNYIRETPFDDSVETHRLQRHFIELNEREPFDDNELFLFIDREQQAYTDCLSDWES